jgi:hypothetical protein
MDDHRTSTREADETPVSTAAQIVDNLLDGDELDPKRIVQGMQQRNPSYAFLELTDLDTFTQQFLEAAFFTEEDRLKEEAVESGLDPDKHDFDWSHEALERAKADCEKFQAENAEAIETGENAGHDFWYTRNHHGVGFWDGDWEEPWATQLDNASKKFPELSAYLGDDGLIYFQ